MNSKAIKRQLLAAIAMVLVAALALGSSTYAWFVASGTVEAKGMKVQAQSEGGIVIRYSTGNWGTSASAGMTADQAKLYPTSTFNLSTWSHATASESGKKDADAKTYKAITDEIMENGNVKENNSYVVMKEFEIRSTSENASDYSKGLYVDSIDVTINNQLPDKNMATALRVGIMLPGDQLTSTANAKNQTSIKIYGPVKMKTEPNKAENQPSTGYTVKFSESDTGTVVNLDTVGKEKSTILSEEFAIPKGITGDNGQTGGLKVRVFIWFEGEDKNLYSDNIDTSELDVSVKFTSISGGKQAPTTPTTPVTPPSTGEQS